MGGPSSRINNEARFYGIFRERKQKSPEKSELFDS
jgi:hypothetical protein